MGILVVAGHGVLQVACFYDVVICVIAMEHHHSYPFFIGKSLLSWDFMGHFDGHVNLP